MSQSATIGELAKALAAAQGEIRGAVKDRENPFFKSSYATLGSVWDAIRAPLTKNGLAVIQCPQTLPEGKVVLETTVAHASGEWITSIYPVRPVKEDPQGYGSALSYSKRYALAAMIGVAAEDDDDGNAASRPAEIPPKPGRKQAPAKEAAKQAEAPKVPAPQPETLTDKQQEQIRSFSDDMAQAATLDQLQTVALELKKEPEWMQRMLVPTYKSAKARLGG